MWNGSASTLAFDEWLRVPVKGFLLETMIIVHPFKSAEPGRSSHLSTQILCGLQSRGAVCVHELEVASCLLNCCLPVGVTLFIEAICRTTLGKNI